MKKETFEKAQRQFDELERLLKAKDAALTSKRKIERSDTDSTLKLYIADGNRMDSVVLSDEVALEIIDKQIYELTYAIKRIRKQIDEI